MIAVNFSGLDAIKTPPELWETMIVGKLKNAGIPIKGVLVFGGVERGTLEWCDSYDGMNFRWYEKRPKGRLCC